MSAFVNFFQDNAMFYKDITQWLRNRTFGSLFFGLLLVAEALSLFVIAGSNDIDNPGVSMFYALYLVLIIYAIMIAYLGNSLTAKEFSNRTFELFELSGMSLERMIGGKLLSMLYQFFFGFFCLVPFMFFAYFLGGLDFVEMLVGIVMICFLALPLYLLSLAGAVSARFKSIALLVRLASLFFISIFTIYAMISLFSNRPLMQGLVREVTEQLKSMLTTSPLIWIGFAFVLLIYAQVCLLLFYFCCDSISRESDSREIPIKVLVLTLILSWLAVHGVHFAQTGYATDEAYEVTVPVFLALLALGARAFYSGAAVAPIVVRRYTDASWFRRSFFSIFKPGIQGGVRTIFLFVALSFVGAVVARSFASTISGDSGPHWRSGLSLLVQVPWFLAIPHVLYVRSRDIRYNYASQRTLAITAWVILGALVLVYMAWTRSNIYGIGGRDNFASVLDILMVTLLSPLSSVSAVGSRDDSVLEAGAIVRLFSGIVGTVLMWNTMRSVMRDEAQLKLDAATGTETDLEDSTNLQPPDVLPEAEPGPTANASEMPDA